MHCHYSTIVHVRHMLPTVLTACVYSLLADQAVSRFDLASRSDLHETLLSAVLGEQTKRSNRLFSDAKNHAVVAVGLPDEVRASASDYVTIMPCTVCGLSQQSIRRHRLLWS